MSEAPERIWAFAPDIFDNCSLWQDMPSPAGDTIEYVRADRIEELEAKLDWVLVERDETFALMLDRAQTAEAKLARAVEALQKMDVGEGWAAQIARTTLAELTGGEDGNSTERR